MSYIHCDCSVDVDEMPEFFLTDIVKARKEHKCCECDAKISVGEKYERVKGKWSGEIFTFKTCLICKRIREDYCPTGWEYGGLQEAIWECLGLNYVTGETAYDDDEDDLLDMRNG
jgi:hypothetical protein